MAGVWLVEGGVTTRGRREEVVRVVLNKRIVLRFQEGFLHHLDDGILLLQTGLDRRQLDLQFRDAATGLRQLAHVGSFLVSQLVRSVDFLG